MAESVFQKLRKRISYIILELLIVFFGVYAAFSLESYKEEQRTNRHRLTFFNAFLMNLQFLDRQAEGLIIHIDSTLAKYTSADVSKTQPPLEYYPEFQMKENMFIIGAAFESELFANIGPSFLVSMNGGSNALKLISESIDDYNRTVRTLLYNQAHSTDNFYDHQGLKGEYQWYIDELKHIKNLLKQLKMAINKGAIPETKSHIKALESAT